MSDYAIELEGVGKTYPHFALQDIDLTLAPGQMMGLIGPNGAGKSSTMRIIMGLTRADAGVVKVLGYAIPEQQAQARRRVAFAAEDMSLYRNATLQWHMDFMARVDPHWEQRYADDLCERFDVRPEQKLKGFSHGQRVKAGLLLVLARRPQVLVLDEPTTGLDPVARREVLDELMDIMLDEERSVLLSSHNTLDVEQLSDQITFIDRGRVVATADKESYLESWRRVRLEIPEGFALPAQAPIVESRTSGHLLTVVTDQFAESLPGELAHGGATVRDVARMTLEEIFVSTVAKSRKGVQA